MRLETTADTSIDALPTALVDEIATQMPFLMANG
jgi:hypothetical protein